MRKALVIAIAIATLLGALCLVLAMRSRATVTKVRKLDKSIATLKTENAKLEADLAALQDQANTPRTTVNVAVSQTLERVLRKYDGMIAANAGTLFGAWKYKFRPDLVGSLNKMLQMGPAGIAAARKRFDVLNKTIRAVPGNGEGQFLSEEDAAIRNAVP